MLDSQGNIKLQGSPVQRDQFGAKLRDLVGSNASGANVTIYADPECAHRHVVDVMKECTAAGMGSIQLAVHDRSMQ
jgi:biopolymer transport protein ExbD